jgi:hypothetical protein
MDGSSARSKIVVEQPGNYSIHIEEQIGTLEAAFEGMNVQQSDKGTLITGYFVDQAALHGVLTRIRDLRLTLISIERKDDDKDGEQ